MLFALCYQKLWNLKEQKNYQIQFFIIQLTQHNSYEFKFMVLQIMTKNVKSHSRNKQNNYYSANVSLNPQKQSYQTKDQKQSQFFSKPYKNNINHASQSILILKQKQNFQHDKVKKKSTKKKNQLSCQSILNFSKKKIGLDTYNNLPITSLNRDKLASSKDVKKCKKKKKIKQEETFMNNFKINFSRSNSFIVFSDKDTTMNNTVVDKLKLGLNSSDHANHLKPIIYNPKNCQKPARNKKHDQQYKQLIQNRAAIIIQKNWRGYLTRKLLQQYINDFEPQFISQLNAYKQSAQISYNHSINNNEVNIGQFDNSMSSIRSRQNVNKNFLNLLKNQSSSIQIQNQNSFDQSYRSQNEEKNTLKQQEKHKNHRFQFQQSSSSEQQYMQQLDSIDSFKRQKPILSNQQFQMSQKDCINQINQGLSNDIRKVQKNQIQVQNLFNGSNNAQSQFLYENQEDQLVESQSLRKQQNKQLEFLKKSKLQNQCQNYKKNQNQSQSSSYDLPRQINPKKQTNLSKVSDFNKEKQSRVSTVHDLKQSNVSNKNSSYYIPMTHAQNNCKVGNYMANSSRITTYINDSQVQISNENATQNSNKQCLSSNIRQHQNISISSRFNFKNNQKVLKIVPNLYTVKILPLPDSQMTKRKQIQDVEQTLRNLFQNKRSECVQVMKDLVKKNVIKFQQFIKRRDLIVEIVNNGSDFIENVISEIRNANIQMMKICFQGEIETSQNNKDDQDGERQQQQNQREEDLNNQENDHQQQSPNNRFKCKKAVHSQYYTIQLPTEEYSCKKISPIQQDKYQEDDEYNESKGSDRQKDQQNSNSNDDDDYVYNTHIHQILNQFLYNIVQEYATFKLQKSQQHQNNQKNQPTQFLYEYLKTISAANIKTIIDRCFIQFTAQLLAQQYDPFYIYEIFKNMIDGSERIVISSLQDEQNQKEQEKIKKVEKLLKKWLQQLQKWQITVIQEMPSGMQSSSFLNTQNISLAEIRQSFCYNSKQFQLQNEDDEGFDQQEQYQQNQQSS